VKVLKVHDIYGRKNIMKKQLKAISACLLSALLATTALPFSKVEAKSKWVE